MNRNRPVTGPVDEDCNWYRFNCITVLAPTPTQTLTYVSPNRRTVALTRTSTVLTLITSTASVTITAEPTSDGSDLKYKKEATVLGAVVAVWAVVFALALLAAAFVIVKQRQKIAGLKCVNTSPRPVNPPREQEPYVIVVKDGMVETRGSQGGQGGQAGEKITVA